MNQSIGNWSHRNIILCFAPFLMQKFYHSIGAPSSSRNETSKSNVVIIVIILNFLTF